MKSNKETLAFLRLPQKRLKYLPIFTTTKKSEYIQLIMSLCWKAFFNLYIITSLRGWTKIWKTNIRRISMLSVKTWLFFCNTPEITMIYYITHLSKFRKKRKLSEIIDFGLWPFIGRHSVLGYPTIFFC